MTGIADWGMLLQGIGAVALALVTLLVGMVATVFGVKITFQNRLKLDDAHRVREGRAFADEGISLREPDEEIPPGERTSRKPRKRKRAPP